MAFHPSFWILTSLLVLVTLSTLDCFDGCVERERLALLDFKKSFESFPQNQGKLSSWNFSEAAKNCCTWEAIICDSSTWYVTSLDLYDHHLESLQLRPSLCELQHLDSLGLSYNYFTMRIPKFIGCFRKLTSLYLLDSGFFGMIPPQLGNLSSLQTLYLNGESTLSTDNFQWLSHLSSLQRLAMDYINFSDARDWVSVITSLPSLSQFICWGHIPTPYVSSTTTHHVNSSSSLQTLVLGGGNFSSSTLSSLLNSAGNLSELVFYVSELDVGIFHSIGNLCSLSSLEVSSCIIKGSLSSIIEAMSDCAISSLDSVTIESSNLTGTFPPMSKFQSLASLSFADNRLDRIPPVNGSLSETLPIFPSSLTSLYLGNNNLTGVLSDVHFANLSQLKDLSLPNNPNLSVHFKKPLIGAEKVDLSFCNIGHNFPSWLLSLNSILQLNISHCKIFDNIPILFWTNLSPNLTDLDLSSNNLYGRVPNIPFEFSYSVFDVHIDLSSNALCGHIPFFLFNARQLRLSNNNFSGFAPVIPHLFNLSASLRPEWSRTPTIVEISNNLLTGLIPRWIGFQMPNLGALILTNNNLSGTIPSSIRHTKQLYVLSLRNNRLSGPLPSVLKNMPTLGILDLGGNIFSGSIPSWMGQDPNGLIVLSLGSNKLSGIIPSGLCRLNSLQVLDLSHNTLSGNIPACIHDFNAMSHYVNSSQRVPYPAMYRFGLNPAYVLRPIEDASFFNAYIKWKNSFWQFQRTNLKLVNLIDLSSNNLSGEIPTGVTTLVELDSLDLSCNNLQGTIPGEIGQLKSLEYLNLSYNRLSGPIPSSLEISSLGMLDLSQNNFSGRIPSGTQLGGFNASAYSGNPYLCGMPLNKCPGDGPDAVQPSPIQDSEMKDKWQEEQCFFAGLGTGFAFGFLGILGSLTCIRKWRYAFFHFATRFGEWILLVAELNISKISRKLQLK